MISGSRVLPSGNSHGARDSVGRRPLRLYDPTQICNVSVLENSSALAHEMRFFSGDTVQRVVS
jgi:hypothetical protein